MAVREIVSPVMQEDGEPVLVAASDVYNEDWLRTRRLQQKAQDGDQDTQEELRSRQDNDMTRTIEGQN